VIIYGDPISDEVRKKALDLGAFAFIERNSDSQILSLALKNTIMTHESGKK
jgi:hypothetical protein